MSAGIKINSCQQSSWISSAYKAFDSPPSCCLIFSTFSLTFGNEYLKTINTFYMQILQHNTRVSSVTSFEKNYSKTLKKIKWDKVSEMFLEIVPLEEPQNVLQQMPQNQHKGKTTCIKAQGAAMPHLCPLMSSLFQLFGMLPLTAAFWFFLTCPCLPTLQINNLHLQKRPVWQSVAAKGIQAAFVGFNMDWCKILTWLLHSVVKSKRNNFHFKISLHFFVIS